MQCISRKCKVGSGRHIQCPHKCISNSKFCGKHVRAKHVLRFDRKLPISKKKAQQTIRRIIHGWIIRFQIRRLYGPAWKNPLWIDDEMDCVTFESFWTKDASDVKQPCYEILSGERFTYIDPWNSRTCGFRFSTILKLSQMKAQHPITRLPLPNGILELCELRVQFMKRHDVLPSDLVKQEVVIETPEEYIELISSRLHDIHMNISCEELNGLTIDVVNNLYVECKNIWYHPDQEHMRQQLPDPVFGWQRRHIRRHQNVIKFRLFQDIWTVIDRIGDSGCYLFVLALGYVCHSIKQRFPYLFI